MGRPKGVRPNAGLGGFELSDALAVCGEWTGGDRSEAGKPVSCCSSGERRRDLAVVEMERRDYTCFTVL